jgi:hypothetical protein
MSYIRWNEDESDVYIYRNTENKLICCSCSLVNGNGDFICDGEINMLAHLRDHKASGDTVPEECFLRIEADIK